MKVLFYFPHGLVGGAEKQVEYLIRGINDPAFQSVVVYRDASVAPFVKQLNRPHTRIYSPEVVRQLQPAIVQSNINQFFPDGFLYKAFKAKPLRPVLMGVVHDRRWSPNSVSVGSGIHDAAIAVSKDAKMHYEATFAGAPCYEITNGVDYTKFNPSIRSTYTSWKDSGRRPCGGFSGRLNEEKGISRLVSIAKLMPGIDFDLVGEGVENYLEKIRSEKIANVRIYPQTSDIASFYGKWDFFISCSPSEGYGLSIAEAVSCGIPSVIWNCGGVTESLRSGKDCIIGGTETEMCNGINDVIDRLWKPVIVNRPDLSHYRMAAKYTELYRQLTKNHHISETTINDLNPNYGSTSDKLKLKLQVLREFIKQKLVST